MERSAASHHKSHALHTTMRDNRRRCPRYVNGASTILRGLVTSASMLVALQLWAMGVAAQVDPVTALGRDSVDELRIHANGATTSACEYNDCELLLDVAANDASGLSERGGEDLLSWATARSSGAGVGADETSGQSPRPPSATRLLIGVKTAALQGFASRQLLRQTWADPTRLPVGVFVVFLGCEPSPSTFNSSHDELQWRDALHMEKATYKDLLTSELDCHDSYFTLVDKVKGFFRWTAAAATSKSLDHLMFVMLVDDDVYVRVDKLTQSLQPITDFISKPSRYYAGEVLTTQLRRTLGIERNPSEKNAVPYAEYPMRHKPPFAAGAHYVLSLDLVQFMARNDRFLKGVGTLEDVSVAYWLQALLGVQPQYVPEFDNVRYTLCHSALIAYADVTPDAIRQMDSNVRSNRSLCHGFSFTHWDKRDFQPEFPVVKAAVPLRVTYQPTYQWDLFYNQSLLVVVTKIMIKATNESVSTVYQPVKVGFAIFCERLIPRLHREMPSETLASDCIL